MRDMTTGRTVPHLVGFAIPLILGNFFQLTYNAVDSIVLGRFSGKASLAAVGIANPVMNIMIFLIAGICMGAGILMSEFYGKKDDGALKREISTTVAMGLAFTAVVSAACFIFVRQLLAAIRTPAALVAPTAHYLRIVFAGLVFTFFYNVFASALRAVGDSRTPIVCVAASAVLNGILDVILVAGFRMGMRGAAVATVASQAVSCALVIGYVYKKEPLLAVLPREFRVERALVRRTAGYAWATALQQVVLYVGKLLIQSAVNPLGEDAIAAFNAGTKIDDFCYQPTQSIGHTITTFMAQNRGAGKRARMRDGFAKGIALEAVYAAFICAAVLLLRRPLVALFAGREAGGVLELGASYLAVMGALYAFPAATNGIQAYFRGTGDMKITVISTTTQISVRVGASFLLAPRMGITGVALACLAGWVAMLAFELPVWVHSWHKGRLSMQRGGAQ